MNLWQEMTSTVGDEIRQAREDAGLRQEDVAAAADVPIDTYRSYEQGKVKNPPHKRVLAIRAAIDRLSGKIQPERSKDSLAFATRLQGLIDQRFKGNVSEFVRKCKEVAGPDAIQDGTIRRYLQGSEPGRDKLVIMARAAGVAVGWLATGEMNGVAPSELVRTGRPKSVQPGDVPRPAEPVNPDVIELELPWIEIDTIGHDTATADIKLRWNRERVRISLPLPDFQGNRNLD